MRRPFLYLPYFLCFLNVLFLPGCSKPHQPHLTIGSKFFTEQVILAELLAQHIEARTGIHVERKTNLGGTLLCQKALQAGELNLEVTEPLGFENTFAMVVRGDDAQRFHLNTISHIVPLAPHWPAGARYQS